LALQHPGSIAAGGGEGGGGDSTRGGGGKSVGGSAHLVFRAMLRTLPHPTPERFAGSSHQKLVPYRRPGIIERRIW
jgi:hypothetical protein